MSAENGNSDSRGPAQTGARRMFIVEPLQDPQDPSTLYADREERDELVGSLLHTLDTVGGVLNIGTTRLQIGEAGGEPIGKTVGYVIQWQAFSPMRSLEEILGLEVTPGDVEHEEPAPA